jgi:hypothetical protein
MRSYANTHLTHYPPVRATSSTPPRAPMPAKREEPPRPPSADFEDEIVLPTQSADEPRLSVRDLLAIVATIAVLVVVLGTAVARQWNGPQQRQPNMEGAAAKLPGIRRKMTNAAIVSVPSVSPPR